MTTAWKWAITASAVLVVAIGWRSSTKLAEGQALQKQQAGRKGSAPQVSVAEAGPREIQHVLDLIGTVESPFTVKLSSKTNGRVNSISVREGDEVKVGQVLVRLDPIQLAALVSQQRSAVAEARSRLAQAVVGQVSNDTNVETGILQQQASVVGAEADVDQSEKTMRAKLQSDKSEVVDADARLNAAISAEKGAKSDLDSARANLLNAQTKLSRAQALYGQGFIALQDVEDAKTTVTVQENLVKSAIEKVSGAHSAVESARAQKDVAEQQVSIDEKKLQADLTASKARLSQSKAAMSSAKANGSQRQAYRQNISALRATVSAAEAQLRQAVSQLNDTSLVSTIEGTVTARAMDPGELATPGQAIVTVQYLKWLYVTASAPVDQSPLMSKGQAVNLLFDAFPGKQFGARIDRINPAADPQSRQFTFQVRLDNPGTKFRPGMYCHVNVVTDSRRAAVVVPREALQKGSVYVMKPDGTLSQRTVKVGDSDSTGVEILSGVEAGEKVVVLSYQALKDGQKVRAAGRSGP